MHATSTSLNAPARAALWQPWFGRSRSPAADPQLMAEIGQRLDEASRLWTQHVGTAQAQMRDAIGHLLASFASILGELDHIITPPQAEPAGSPRRGIDIDARAAMLTHCEAKLLGLLQCRSAARSAVR